MDVEQILNAIREHYGLGRNADFARYMGVSPQTANSFSKRQSLDYDLIHEKFPEISAEWLLSKGENGEMIKSQTHQTINGNGNMTAGGDIRVGEQLQHANLELKAALDFSKQALLNEQETCRKMQSQIDSMLEIMHNLSKERNKE